MCVCVEREQDTKSRDYRIFQRYEGSEKVSYGLNTLREDSRVWREKQMNRQKMQPDAQGKGLEPTTKLCPNQGLAIGPKPGPNWGFDWPKKWSSWRGL